MVGRTTTASWQFVDGGSRECSRYKTDTHLSSLEILATPTSTPAHMRGGWSRARSAVDSSTIPMHRTCVEENSRKRHGGCGLAQHHSQRSLSH